MKQYLADFMVEFGYDIKDAEDLLSAFGKIESNPAAKRDFYALIDIYEGDVNCDYLNKILPSAQEIGDSVGLHPYTSDLLIFMCLTKRLKEIYIQRNIDLGIYKNTILDLKYKLEECKAVYGIVGSFVAKWFVGFFNLTRFALGRLQFEIVNFGREYNKNGISLTPDTKVINVHIPRTMTPIDKESCDAAYSMAREFFCAEVGEDCPFVCHSWLLYPEHEKILPKSTNTYRFFAEYDVIEYTENNGEDLWRLFDTMEKNPDKLPTDTSLRRCYVDHLKRGGRVGVGYGIKI